VPELKSHSQTAFEINDDLLTRLREAVVLRRIESGIEWFQTNRQAIRSLDPQQKNAAAFVGYFSQWVDIGYGDEGIVRELLERFPKETRTALPLTDYIHLRLAEGMAASAEEETLEAIRHFDFIISLDEEVADKQLLALAHFWKGRCQRKLGEYKSALTHTVKGRELALELGYRRMAAVMQVLESWLHFQKKELPQAAKLLEEAEAIVLETDDSVTLGNIHSGYGRIAQDEARYDRALEHFANAIEWYRKRDPRHRNLARSLANMAYVKRLIAVRWERGLDAEVARRRKLAGRDPVESGPAGVQIRQRIEQLRAEASSNLAQAEDIYRSLHHHRGLGTVRIERGRLFVDHGDLERAEFEAGQAYELGADKRDFILMARARLLESTIEASKYEEGIDDDPASHAQRAHDYAQDAFDCARHTENHKLLARTHIRLGQIFCTDFFNDPVAAQAWCDRAAEYLSPGNDELWGEYQSLKVKLLRRGSVDARLRKWSQGLIDGQTFQQMTDEFENLIVPKVWEREGRKVSRVATKLSISPKKVRRILTRLGLKGE
jgi:tetratricopeptide (TPR) repeat protein